MPHLQGWHLVIIIVLALLLFAGPKLPKIARSLGQSMRIFKSEVRQMKDDDKPGTAATPPSPAAPSSPTAAPHDPAQPSQKAPVEGRIVDDGPQGPRA
ncbi:Sec-independent protein translocase subunit TatA [Galactobacter caseinivorans]|uniref:Sec-independent protein translocase protein TatA n=1 Tax=Galactobacter caseinivorans TaxID=2676123 RepID=A0A496PKT3_9MICC|nr:Sec-independent protein translocase subunit TatA [Galactobacter caseinivorans]RKW71114.1 Sec-independent protein translocase TatA [Galactobacter caseinivorans]